MIVALTGGIGGAKLALGLVHCLADHGPEALTLIVNTGDDFEHLGLSVSPDLDTLMYTLAGLENPQTGWGQRDETWQFMDALQALGGETWFRLGDRDLATHVERTRRLRDGQALSGITADFCRRLGIGCQVLPMTDDRVRTRVACNGSWLDFQDYFVRRRCEPRVDAIRYDGAAEARPAPGVLAALADPSVRAVIICPSNPWLSVDPILAMPALREAIAGCSAPVIAVSPIIGGRAVKGPTAKIMTELGLDASAAVVARHYAGLLDRFVVDEVDADLSAAACGGVAVDVRRTLMTTREDRITLAREVLGLAGIDSRGR